MKKFNELNKILNKSFNTQCNESIQYVVEHCHTSVLEQPSHTHGQFNIEMVFFIKNCKNNNTVTWSLLVENVDNYNKNFSLFLKNLQMDSLDFLIKYKNANPNKNITTSIDIQKFFKDCLMEFLTELNQEKNNND